MNEAQARQNLRKLLDDFHKLTPEQRQEMTEASVVRQFIDRLLEEVLGWPIKDPQRYQYELHTQVGRPDLTLFPESGGVIFVEAKRFGVIKDLYNPSKTLSTRTLKPSQMALAGMAADRTPEEQQAINYAFANGGTWAILTNFEKLRLFNARRDWLVLSFDDPYDYQHDFDLLWQLAYPNVIRGSLDSLSSQRHARDIDSQYLDFINEWRERLAQDVIARRDQNAWAFNDDGSINLTALRAVVQRFLDRLVVIRFAEDHLVIPPGTLRQFYELRRNNPYTSTMDEFLDTFFRRFDDNHNSALFATGLADLAVFGDDALLPLVEKLYEVRYRALPADILGNTYEQYLGKTLALDDGSVKTRDNLETRKKQGSYYTPQVIVRYIVDNSLGRYLYGTENGQPDGRPIGDAAGAHGGAPLQTEGMPTRKTARDILNLRVLDSACGSGSFLIYAYQVLARFYESEIERLNAELDARIKMLAARMEQMTTDDRIENQRIENEIVRLRDYPRLILETHLYGVDLDPQAAEIATVNLIMRAMESRHHEKRLPLILGQNVKVGNSLVGKVLPHPPTPDGEGEEKRESWRAAIVELIRLRRLLTTDPDKGKPQPEIKRDARHFMTLDEALQIPNHKAREEAVQAVTRRLAEPTAFQLPSDTSHETYYELEAKTQALREKLNGELADHFTDLDRVRPFHWGLEFPEAFYDEHGEPLDNPGFTLIFGNPPWEIVKPDLREFYAQFDPHIESHLNRAQVEKRIAELEAEDPRRQVLYEAQTQYIEQTAAYVRGAPDYARQGRGDTATHKLFIERMWTMLQDTGRLGYVAPSGIYTDLGTKDLREMFLNEGNFQYIYSFSNERFFFPGVDHRFKFALIGAQKGPQSDGFWAAFRFNPRVAVTPDDLPAFLTNPDNLIYVRRESLERFSPDSLSLMEFQTQRDYEIAEKIYDGWPLLGEENPHPPAPSPILREGGESASWSVRFNNEFHFTNDRQLLNQNREGMSFYEGKMIHQYEAFYAPPQFWISFDKVSELPELLQNQLKTYRVVHRRIARSTDERTLIAAIVPPNSACEINATVVLITDNTEESTKLFVCALLNSFVLDFIIRNKVATTLNMFYMQSLPVPRLTPGDPYFDALVPRAARLTCTRSEFADLWREVMGREWETPPPNPLPVHGEGEKGYLAVDSSERQRLRDEIDAIVAHLYGLSRDEFDHILGTFPLVFPDSDEGRARRAALLAVYETIRP